MKVIIFTDPSAGTIQTQINAWLDRNGKAVIVKTDVIPEIAGIYFCDHKQLSLLGKTGAARQD